MLNTTVSLDEGIAAVVVGEEQTFVRNDLPGATAAEKDDGILKGSLVDTVDVLSRKLETFACMSPILWEIRAGSHIPSSARAAPRAVTKMNRENRTLFISLVI